MAKPALEDVTPVELALARASLAALTLFIASLAIARRGPAYVAREGRTNWKGVALVGLISFTGTSLLAMTAQRLLPASVNGLLNNLSPLWIAVFTATAGAAHSAPLLIAGASLAAAGVAAVLLGGGETAALTLSAETALGVAISLAGSLLIACANLVTRRVMSGRDPLALTAVAAGWGALPLLALTLAGAGASLESLLSASNETKLRLVWLGTVSTAFNFSLWSYALAHLPDRKSVV